MEWLLLLYQLPARPSTARVMVWRQLKALGVCYLQNSACILPGRPTLRKAMEGMAREIQRQGGHASLVPLRPAEGRVDRTWVARFRKQADEEYVELLKTCREYFAELATERRKEHFSYAELEENQAEYEKLVAWSARIRQRDFFGARLGRSAGAMLERCRKDLTRFALEVDAAEQRVGRPSRP